MLAELWPTYALRIRTPRLTLRLPDENELAALAEVAAQGIHKAGERPFLTPWTEGGPEDRARNVLQGHWDDLASWTPRDWTLGLGVFLSGDQPIGMVTLVGRHFRVVREVITRSWLGVAHHRQGLGTGARTGVLTLAFDHLGATDATTEVFPDNHASQGVSRKLGYLPDGISRDARDDEVLVSDRLRLTAARWAEISPAGDRRGGRAGSPHVRRLMISCAWPRSAAYAVYGGGRQHREHPGSHHPGRNPTVDPAATECVIGLAGEHRTIALVGECRAGALVRQQRGDGHGRPDRPGGGEGADARTRRERRRAADRQDRVLRTDGQDRVLRPERQHPTQSSYLGRGGDR